MADSITLRVITPETIVLDTTAESVQIPGVDGLIGILHRHAPMVAALGAGPMTYVSNGQSRTMFVSTGFCEVRDDTVRVVTDASELPEQIDLDRAKEALERAKLRLRGRRGGGQAAVDLDTIRA